MLDNSGNVFNAFTFDVFYFLTLAYSGSDKSRGT